MNYYEIHLELAALMIGVFLVHLMFGKVQNAWSAAASFGFVSVILVYFLGFKEHDLFYYINKLSPEELTAFKEHAMYVLGLGLLMVIFDKDGYGNASIGFAIMFLIGELLIYGQVLMIYFVTVFFILRGFNELYDGIAGR